MGGGRNIGSASVGNASVSGAGPGGSRGPTNGTGRLTDSTTRGSVSGANEGERGSGLSAGNGNAAGAAGGTATRTGGGGGPQGQAGRAGGGGGGGAAARASGGGDAGVETKNENKEEKKPIVKKDGDVVDKKPAGSESKRNEDAEPTFEPTPELTSDMKKRQFKTSVRVRVTIDADGSHDEEIIQGTGDDEIDQLILRTMRRWKWRPAWKDGEKTKSTRPYSFRISID